MNQEKSLMDFEFRKRLSFILDKTYKSVQMGTGVPIGFYIEKEFVDEILNILNKVYFHAQKYEGYDLSYMFWDKVEHTDTHFFVIVFVDAPKGYTQDNKKEYFEKILKEKYESV